MRLTDAVEKAKLIFTEIKPYESLIFEIVDPQENRQTCEFVDPYDGKFTIDGLSGYTTVNEYLSKNPMVENMKIVPRRK